VFAVNVMMIVFIPMFAVVVGVHIFAALCDVFTCVDDMTAQ